MGHDVEEISARWAHASTGLLIHVFGQGVNKQWNRPPRVIKSFLTLSVSLFTSSLYLCPICQDTDLVRRTVSGDLVKYISLIFASKIEYHLLLIGLK